MLKKRLLVRKIGEKEKKHTQGLEMQHVSSPLSSSPSPADPVDPVVVVITVLVWDGGGSHSSLCDTTVVLIVVVVHVVLPL